MVGHEQEFQECGEELKEMNQLFINMLKVSDNGNKSWTATIWTRYIFRYKYT